MPRSRRMSVGRIAAVLVVAGAVMLAAAPAADARRAPKPTVMTQNLYLGSGLIAAAVAPNKAEFESKAATVWQNVQATDFPSRAKALARLIHRADPDLVGLQEVTTWYRSPNGVKDGYATRSKIVVYDFLKSLLRELNKRGPKYRAVASDGLPTDIEASTSLGYDIRFRLGNVILAKRERGLSIRRKLFRIYADQFSFNTQGGPFGAKRAWVAVDAVFHGRPFRFVDTHLESEGAPARAKQALELVSRAGPLRVKGQKVLVGDLNSDTKGRSNDSPEAYTNVVRAGFQDAWKSGGHGQGLTSGDGDELLNTPRPTFDERIDYVLLKPARRILRATVLGAKRSDRTASGLWPSDHAGLAVTFRLGR
jgi:endonuclease/exonuclease/phosphatase family metal-dependent hydrolase